MSSNTTYYTLASVGYWGSLTARCETTREEYGSDVYLLNHNVTFVMLNEFGDRLHMGHSIFGQAPDGLEVFDENGEDFPSLVVAMQHHAEDVLRIVHTLRGPSDKPVQHKTWQGETATAF